MPILLCIFHCNICIELFIIVIMSDIGRHLRFVEMGAPLLLGLRFRIPKRIDPVFINISETITENIITISTLHTWGSGAQQAGIIKSEAGATVIVRGQVRFKAGNIKIPLWINANTRIEVDFTVIYGFLEPVLLGNSFLEEFRVCVTYAPRACRKISFYLMNENGMYLLFIY